MTPMLLAVTVGFALVVPSLAWAQAAQAHRDVTYARVDGKDLRLDIYVPAGVQAPPLLVWVHGGVWANGTKAEVPLEARFPAQVHDIKAAVRFLRARATDYGYRAERIAIGGDSSAVTWRLWSV